MDASIGTDTILACIAILVSGVTALFWDLYTYCP